MMARNTYAVGRNMPGYMPDINMEYFTNWTAARDCYLDMLDKAIDAEIKREGKNCYSIESRAILRISKQQKYQAKHIKIGAYIYFLERI